MTMKRTACVPARPANGARELIADVKDCERKYSSLLKNLSDYVSPE